MLAAGGDRLDVLAELRRRPALAAAGDLGDVDPIVVAAADQELALRPEEGDA
ncbi:MAG: hypothetical protein H6710_01945 [Myxococcales bacterium]|nr:hypothetical protein [Myxococcales bacterium]